jgi:hypothetical protein
MSTLSASAPPLRGSIVDRLLWTISGYLLLGIVVVLIALSAWLAYTGLGRGHIAPPWLWLAGAAIILAILLLP